MKGDQWLAGHGVLALWESEIGLAMGLALISLGAGDEPLFRPSGMVCTSLKNCDALLIAIVAFLLKPITNQ